MQSPNYCVKITQDGRFYRKTASLGLRRASLCIEKGVKGAFRGKMEKEGEDHRPLLVLCGVKNGRFIAK